MNGTAHTTIVHLTAHDVELFKQFQKRYDIISQMEQHGLFDIQFGKGTLNFAFGELQNIIKEEIVYKKT